MIKKRGKKYSTEFSFQGTMIREATGTADKQDAYRIAFALLTKLEADAGISTVAAVNETAAPTTPMTLTEFADQHFLPWVAAHNERKPKSKDYYVYGWSFLSTQAPTIANMSMAKIKPSHLSGLNFEWDPHRRRGTKAVWIPVEERDPEHPWVRVSPSTHNCALRTLSRMFSIAVEMDVIPSRYRIHKLREKERDRLAPEVEQQAGDALASKRRRRGSLPTAFFLIMDGGMRPFEIADLYIENINFLDYPAAGVKMGKAIHVVKSKSVAGERFVPMTPRMMEKLRVQIGTRTGGPVFPSPRYPGQPIKSKSLAAAWKKHATKLGLDSEAAFYCLRHSYGTDFYAATTDLFKTMKVMGQTDPRTLKRYQHPDLDGAADQLVEHRRLMAERRRAVQP